MPPTETIAAIATPPGRGGIGVIRLSGDLARTIGEQLARLRLRPRHAHFCTFHATGGNAVDSGICLFFPAPNSFTGEDVVELQAHGSPVVLDLLLREACHMGARLARPGEFSERAFLNNKIDLAQAEAIADLIESSTEAAALSATRSLQGEFSRQVENLVFAVTSLRVYVEGAIDFPEEEIDFLDEGDVLARLEGIQDQLRQITGQARQGSLLRDGMKLVIAGRPNAGKSSLLNALSGQDTAIVTPIEGTTRDVLREHIQLDGMPMHIVDTAGLRDSPDIIEQEGIRRAWREMESADRILLVVDDATVSSGELDPDSLWPERGQHLGRDIPVTIVCNKCDLTGREPSLLVSGKGSVLHLSAKTGAGMELLRNHLKQSMGYSETEGGFSARRRHLDALERAGQLLENGRVQLTGSRAGELLAEDLRQCQACLGEITGAVSSDELLGRIFSSFCIGK